MAYFDDVILNNDTLKNNFKGYTGNPPTNAQEYNSMDLWNDGFDAPTWVEIQSAIELAEVRAQRSEAYPKIAEQLDLLYHDIKNGTLDSGTWIQAIEAVKTEFPKP